MTNECESSFLDFPRRTVSSHVLQLWPVLAVNSKVDLEEIYQYMDGESPSTFKALTFLPEHITG